MPGLKIGSALNELGQKFFASNDLTVSSNDLLWKTYLVLTKENFTVSDELTGSGTKDSPLTWKGLKVLNNEETSLSENSKILKAGANIIFSVNDGTLTISGKSFPDLNGYMLKEEYAVDGVEGVVKHAQTTDTIGENTAEQVSDAIEKSHIHENSAILDKLSESEGNLTFDGKPIESSSSSVDWNNITNKPETFNPSEHDHTKSDITDLTEASQENSGLMSAEDKIKLDSITPGEGGGALQTVKWEDIQDKPKDFPPQEHLHEISEVENLQTTLDTFGKVKSVNGIPPDDKGNITINFETGVPFSVTWESIEDKPDTFKPEAHKHEIQEVSNLEEALKSKVSSVNGQTPDENGNVSISLSSEGSANPEPGSGTVSNIKLPLIFRVPKSEKNLHLEVTYRFFDSVGDYTALINTKENPSDEKLSMFRNEEWGLFPDEGANSSLASCPVMIKTEDVLDPTKLYTIKYRWFSLSGEEAVNFEEHLTVYPSVGGG